MTTYRQLSEKDLQSHLEKLNTEYAACKARGLKLDMSRGKPAADQLNLSMEMMDVLTSKDLWKSENNLDVRNYGLLEGLPEMRALFAELTGLKSSEVFVGGNSSLNLMFDTVSRAMQFGLPGGNGAWNKEKTVKFLCPVPGYDRHFKICETFGIEMINVPMTATGPDMDIVEQLVADPTVKGIWCVPMYSNPDGITYSDETVRRFAALKPAAGDFRIYWDNAYCVHHVTDAPDTLLNLMDECRAQNSEDMVFIFASTSKISFSGAGVAMFGCSERNMKHMVAIINAQTIGFDKMNQLRHIKFFKNADGVKAHMQKHKELIAPKFSGVLERLANEIAPLGIADWKKPNGGYFISLNTLSGCAKRVVELCKQAGVVLTPAGATFPYGIDPLDRNIRIAPTFPTIEELTQATEILCLCIKIASAEKMLAEKKRTDKKDKSSVA